MAKDIGQLKTRLDAEKVKIEAARTAMETAQADFTFTSSQGAKLAEFTADGIRFYHVHGITLADAKAFGTWLLDAIGTQKDPVAKETVK